MKLSVVLINFNTASDTIACINSLKAAKIPPNLQVEYLLIDNASKDDSVKVLVKKLPDIPLVINQTNTGFTGGNNLGITESLKKNPTHILLLNNDTIVPPDFFQQIKDSAINKPKVGLLTPKIYFAKGYEFHAEKYQDSELGKVIWSAGGIIDWANVYGSNAHVDEVDQGQLNQVEETDFATGACLLIKREVIDRIGMLDARYFMYLEDLEYSIRAKSAGFKIVFDPKVYLWHKVARSSGIGSSLNDYFITRNRLLFGLTYARMRTKIALIREALKFLIRGRPAQRAGVKDFILMRFGKGSFLKN